MECRRCQLEKGASCFPMNGKVRRNVCKECVNAKARARYIEDSGRAIASSRAYRIANKELVNEKSRLRKQANRLQRAQQRTGLVIKPSWKGPRALHDWHVKAWFALPAQERRRRRSTVLRTIAGSEQCDAHVRRYQQVMRSRVYGQKNAAIRYQLNPDAERARVRAYKAKLPDAVVIEKLRLPKDWNGDVPQSLIDLKREQLLMRRLSRQLKEAAHHSNREQYETISQHA